MVKKALLKETINFIKKNLKTYIAQIVIIMLGVGFFIGMKTSVKDLKHIMQNFVDGYNLYDFKVSLEYGIEKNDIEEIGAKLENLKLIEPGYSLDVAVDINNVNSVIKLHSYNPKNQINQLKLIEGELPSNLTECVIDTALKEEGYNIGDTLTITNEFLNVEVVQITGIVQSPNYLAVDRGNSNLLSGKINYYVYLHEDNVNSSLYSEFYLQYNHDNKAFTNNYDNYISKEQDRIKKVVTHYYKKKYDKIITEEQKKIDEAKKDYEEKRKEAEKKYSEYDLIIKEKQEQIDSIKEKLLSASEIDKKVQAELKNREITKAELEKLKVKIDQLTKEYNNYKNSVSENEKAITKQITEIDSQIKSNNDIINNNNTLITNEKNNLSINNNLFNENNNKINDYVNTIANYDAQISKLQEDYNKEFWPSKKRKIKEQITALEEERAPYYTYKSELEQKNNEITNSNSQISKEISKMEEQNASLNKSNQGLTNRKNSLKESLNNHSDEYSAYEQQIEKLKKDYNTKLKLYSLSKNYNDLYEYYKKENDQIQRQLTAAQNEIQEAEQKLEKVRIEMETEFNKIQSQIEDAQDKIDVFSYPKNYITTRSDISSYGQFVDDINKISNLGKIIPVIFYIIAFLMINSSLNKVMYEERNQIGTLKALGIKNSEIRKKYSIYAVSIVVIGSVFGFLIGIYAFPYIIYHLYSILYEFSNIAFIIDRESVLVSILIALGVSLLSTFIACRKTFQESPISLLKVKVEKYSKRVLLERIPFIWNRLSFSTKIALKNVFKYKSRIVMTVVGIGGCLALILTGLSLRSAIVETIPLQYGDIFKLDTQIFYKDTATRSEIAESSKKIQQFNNVEELTEANYSTVTTKKDNKQININMVTFGNDNYKDFISLIDAYNNTQIDLPADGVIITQKIAENLGVKIDDEIKITDAKNEEKLLKIKGITKNYIDHYIYLNSEYYRSIYNLNPRNNMNLLRLKGDYKEFDLAQDIYNLGSVSQITYTSISKVYYEDLMNVLSILVGIFIIFSVLLIFAVLYNLINMNVLERTKEIATYKVLGFKERTIIAILKKENTILLFLGVIFGLVFGKELAVIVIKTLEIENMNFVKDISTLNYGIAVGFTVIFTYIFSGIINKYVKKINLTESLKKNE